MENVILCNTDDAEVDVICREREREKRYYSEQNKRMYISTYQYKASNLYFEQIITKVGNVNKTFFSNMAIVLTRLEAQRTDKNTVIQGERKIF